MAPNILACVSGARLHTTATCVQSIRSIPEYGVTEGSVDNAATVVTRSETARPP